MYTSRTAIECYNCVCRHKRYVNYLYQDGIGLTYNSKDIALVFGSAVHLGIEYLLKGADFATSLSKSIDYLTEAYNNNEFTDRKTTDIDYSFEEHKALAEALLYSYYLTEYEFIAENYNIIAVEQEFETILSHSHKLNEDVILLSKVDAVLQHKQTYDIHTYSVKTDKDLYYQTTESHANDLQGLTEIWATEQWGSRLLPSKQAVLDLLTKFADDKAINNVTNYLNKKYPTFDKVSAVRFCHLIKGKRWEYEDGTVHTINPLIYGYRKAFYEDTANPTKPSGYAYAFNYSYNNQANKSGTGKLGKGWDKFAVWKDYPLGVQGWIDDILHGEIQPDEDNPLLKHVIVPEPYYRDELEVKEAIDSIKYQELQVLEDSKNSILPITTLFPKNRKSCNYPVVCEFKDFCFRPVINSNPIESGLYAYRKSHHKKELEYQQERLNRVSDITVLLDEAKESSNSLDSNNTNNGISYSNHFKTK